LTGYVVPALHALGHLAQVIARRGVRHAFFSTFDNPFRRPKATDLQTGSGARLRPSAMRRDQNRAPQSDTRQVSMIDQRCIDGLRYGLSIACVVIGGSSTIQRGHR